MPSPHAPVPASRARGAVRAMIAATALPLVLAFAAPLHAAAAGYRVDTVASGLAFPWSLAFLPDGRLLVSERPGRLRLIERGADGGFALRAAPVAGVPPVLAQGQAGLFDVVVEPGGGGRAPTVFLSFAHGSPAANHLRVVRARLDGDRLADVVPVFTSQPAKTHSQHFGGRIAFAADGTLVVGIGDGNLDRTDAQRLHTHLGKHVRIDRDGRVPRGNPFAARAGARPEIWTTGHRNPQGIVRVGDALYAHEHGSKGGDELNRLVAGANYGWPITTDGVDYTGARITPYRSRPGVTAPLLHWTPSIAPAGLAYYDGALFPAWRGSLFLAALKEKSVRRVPLRGGRPGAQEVLFAGLGERIRDVRAGPDGALYLLTDSAQGRVLRVAPAR